MPGWPGMSYDQVYEGMQGIARYEGMRYEGMQGMSEHLVGTQAVPGWPATRGGPVAA